MFTRVTALANLAVKSTVLGHVNNGHLNATITSAESLMPGTLGRNVAFQALEICAVTWCIITINHSWISLPIFPSFFFFFSKKNFVSPLYKQ